MSQRAFLADLDATIHATMAGAGMADAGAYTAPEGMTTETCHVYVDRDIQTVGDTQQFVPGRVEVAYVLGSMVQVPKKRGTVMVDGDTYVNDEPISNDGSLSRWVVRRG